MGFCLFGAGRVAVCSELLWSHLGILVTPGKQVTPDPFPEQGSSTGPPVSWAGLRT